MSSVDPCPHLRAQRVTHYAADAGGLSEHTAELASTLSSGALWALFRGDQTQFTGLGMEAPRFCPKAGIPESRKPDPDSVAAHQLQPGLFNQHHLYLLPILETLQSFGACITPLHTKAGHPVDHLFSIGVAFEQRIRY